MSIDKDFPTWSYQDIIDTTQEYLDNNSPEISDTILYFVSELTGRSVDALITEDLNVK